MDPSMCFELAEIPRPSAGYWKFALSFSDAGDTRSLVIERAFMGAHGGRVSRVWDPIELPLYYDPLSRRCLARVVPGDGERGVVAAPREGVVPRLDSPA